MILGWVGAIAGAGATTAASFGRRHRGVPPRLQRHLRRRGTRGHRLLPRPLPARPRVLRPGRRWPARLVLAGRVLCGPRSRRSGARRAHAAASWSWRARPRRRALGGAAPGLLARLSTWSGRSNCYDRGRERPRAAPAGQARRVAAGAHAPAPDVVLLAGGAFDSAGEMRRLAWALENDYVQVVIAPSVTDVARERVRVRPVGGLPLIHIEKPRSTAALRRAKRGFDVVGSLALLVLLLSPDRDWPQCGSACTTRARCCSGPDPRRTRRSWTFPRAGKWSASIGRLMRRYALDELPQLLNVLTGRHEPGRPSPPLGA